MYSSTSRFKFGIWGLLAASFLGYGTLVGYLKLWGFKRGMTGTLETRVNHRLNELVLRLTLCISEVLSCIYGLATNFELFLKQPWEHHRVDPRLVVPGPLPLETTQIKHTLLSRKEWKMKTSVSPYLSLERVRCSSTRQYDHCPNMRSPHATRRRMCMLF